MQANTTLDEMFERGAAAQAGGKVEEAEACFRAVISADPLDVRARQYLGVQLAAQERAAEGVELLRTTVALLGPLRPETTAAYNNLANALRQDEQYDEAEEMLRELCRLAPDAWEHWHNLALLLKDTHRENEAIGAIRRACTLEPGYGPNHGVLGHILHTSGRLFSAQTSLQRCIDLGWDNDPNVWTVLGNNFRWRGEMAKAYDATRRAYELSSDSATATSNLAIVLTQAGKFEEALEYHRRAVALEPDNPTWRANLGYAELTEGDLDRGWADWEAGLGADGPRGAERATDVPRWTPDDHDVRVLCYREQGVGDEMLLTSCLPDLAAVAREVVYECNPRLVSLFARSFPQCEVRAQSGNAVTGETMSDFDRAISIGSLPLYFRPALDAFPTGRRSFLVPDPERVDRWRQRLADLGPGLTVAFAWRSQVKTAERRVEYTNLLEDWEPLFSIPGVHWLSVQYDDCERELASAEQRYGVTIHRDAEVDYMNDFEEVAAILCASDLAIAPRNAVAMLGGALGCPTVVMGNRWDWSDLGTDTLPWFPTAELIFRHLGEEWGPVIEKAAARVREAAARKDAEACST